MGRVQIFSSPRLHAGFGLALRLIPLWRRASGGLNLRDERAIQFGDEGSKVLDDLLPACAVTKYSCCNSSSWFTEPVTCANSRTHLLFLIACLSYLVTVGSSFLPHGH